MTTTYNKSEIFKNAWETFKSLGHLIERYDTFSKCLKASWHSAKLDVEWDKKQAKLNEAFVAEQLNGNQWQNRVYFNCSFGSIWTKRIDGKWMLNIKKDYETTPTDIQMLMKFIDEKAKEMQDLGLILC